MNMRFYDLIFCFLQKFIFLSEKIINRNGDTIQHGFSPIWVKIRQKKTPVVTGALMGFNIPPSLLSSIFNNWSRGGGERWVKKMYLNHHY